jgi:uncharacterized protein (TIGR02145 family)
VSTASDRANCGRCDNACDDGQVCSNGTCALSCQTGLTDCDGSCVSTATDRANCGVCGHACDPGQVCSGGVCALSCQSQLAECDGLCVDTATDLNHCGSCETHCLSGEVCLGGNCVVSCQTGLTDCSAQCIDTRVDPNNCGGCGTRCTDGFVCSSGNCALTCQSGLTDCSGTCRDLKTDRGHCGACDNACAAGQVCENGACVVSCSEGLASCGGSCSNTSYDPANCGVCGNVCVAEAHGEPFCAAGACELACESPFADCDATYSTGCETNTSTSTASCGTCGNVCGAVDHATPGCQNGRCTPVCSGSFADCDGAYANGCEADTATDVAHCGRCDNACATGNRCISGVCTPPACNDGIKNGTETGVDCGGSCSPCADGGSCLVGSDCQSGSCASGTCSFTCGQTLTDSRDGKQYGTVLIGSTCWMRQNLDYGTYVPVATPQSSTGAVTKWCYGNNQSNCNLWGGQYTYANAVRGQVNQVTQGICPAGWRIPTSAEWLAMSANQGSRQFTVSSTTFSMLFSGRYDTQWYYGTTCGSPVYVQTHHWYSNDGDAGFYWTFGTCPSPTSYPQISSGQLDQGRAVRCVRQ